MAVIAGTGVDMDIPNGLIGNGRTGRAQGRRIKVVVCHRATSVSVSTSSARGLHPDSLLHWSPLAVDQPVPRLPRAGARRRPSEGTGPT
ncbi:hypothetical protein [Streptomyces sp. AGS-58]|uniref:hypothetical protein n=1 Tax=unclassified Streptomyces TaxID=2593676 RepID=UPI0035A2E37E